MSYFQINLNNTNYQFRRIVCKGNSQNNAPIILLHDSFGCIELWRDFPERLSFSLQRDVYVYDRQGYGKSDPIKCKKRNPTYLREEAEILIHLTDQLCMDKAVLFGHSDGATISLLAASLYPERIQAVISEAAHVFVEEITLNGIRRAVYAYNNFGLKERLERYHGDKTELLFKLWHETWLSENFKSWNMLENLSKILCPLLIIQGDQDEYGSMRQVDYIHECSMGYSEKYILQETGHSPHKEHPEKISEKVFSFLKTVI